MNRPGRTTITLAFASLGVATVSRLLGLLDHVASVLGDLSEIPDVAVAFLGPVVVASVPLFVVTWLVSRRVPLETPSGSEPLEPSFDEVDLENPDVEALRRLLGRSEKIVEKQLDTLTDTDDKALRTVRVEAVLLGAIATAAQIAPESIPVNVWMELGGTFVVASIVAGIFTYSSSSPDLGPGPRDVHETLVEDPTETCLYLELLDEYRESIDHNRGVVFDSARYLYVTQALLVLGIVFGGIGILIVLGGG